MLKSSFCVLNITICLFFGIKNLLDLGDVLVAPVATEILLTKNLFFC